MSEDKKIPIEIERKWILRKNPNFNNLNKPVKIFHIHQIYSSNGWRYRKQEEYGIDKIGIITRFFRTKKTPYGLGCNIEEEYEITADQFSTCDEGKTITKIRQIYNYNGLKFEIDIFADLSLVIMEVELDSIDQEIEIPGFLKELIIIEVTGIKEFNNSSLAR